MSEKNKVEDFPTQEEIFPSDVSSEIKEEKIVKESISEVKNEKKKTVSTFFDKNLYHTNKSLSKKDYEFMNSLSAATMQMQPKKLHWVLVAFVVTVTIFIVWASYAEIDEIARGSGKVVPSGQNQILQNLEGGIVSEILVKEGDTVIKDQTLIRINNEKSESTMASSALRILFLQAQTQRLQAELNQAPFSFTKSENEQLNQFFENEKRTYDVNKQQLESQIQILNEQMNQRKSDLKDAIQSQEHFKISLSMITEEVKMTKPMVDRGIRSQVDFLKLQREENDAEQKFNSSGLTIEKINSEVSEIENKIKEAKETYVLKAGQEFNEKLTELKELQASSSAYEDQVSRTTVKSPSNGIVQKLYVNTIGGAIKPAQDLIEIVPTDFNLIVEIKVLPSDIAFIYQGQKAIIKFSAYDFAIFGGLNGKVINISPDTITEKDGNQDKTYYLVRIQTDKNFLGSEAEPRKIIPGMIADADIITGKKTILDYILKPILKTKQYTFTER